MSKGEAMVEKIKEALEYCINGRWVSGLLPLNRRRQDRRLADRRQGGERRDPLGRNERRKGVK